jgi:phage-related protein
MADGKHIEVAKAYVTIVPSLEGSQKTIATEMGAAVEPAAKQAGEKGGKNLGESLAKGLKTTTAVIGAAMAAATASVVATGKAFINAANDVASYGDNIDKMSQKMGISAKGYQEWDFIMKHAGASIDSLKGSMKTLANAAVNGSDAFQKLGISQQDIANMSQEELFNKTISALQNVKDETTRTALASKVLGKGATELGALFNMSSEETEGLRQQVHDLGGVMSDEAVKAAADYQDSMQNMQTSLTGIKNNLMGQFLPGMSSVMQGLSKVFAGDKSGMGAITMGIQSVIQNITAMAPQFITIISTIVNSLITAFGPMLPQLVSALFGFITQVLTTFTTMIPQLTPVITMGLQGIAQALLTCLPVLIQGLMGVITGIVTWLSSGDNVKTFVDGILQLVSTLAEGFADMLPILLPAIVNIIGQIAQSLTDPKNVKMIVTSALYIVGAVVMALVKALPEIGGVIVKLGANILNTLKGIGSSILARIGPWFTETLGKIGGFVANIISKIASLPGKVLDIGKNLVSGLWKGISEKLNWLKDRIESFGKGIINKVKSVFSVHSPSKVFAEIGGFLAEGLGVGFESEIGDVESNMAKSMNGLTGNMTATVSAQGAPGDLMGNTTNYNGGAVTINVYGAEGQSVNELADVIAIKLQEMTTRRSMVYA